jgi:hypothetical protein
MILPLFALSAIGGIPTVRANRRSPCRLGRSEPNNEGCVLAEKCLMKDRDITYGNFSVIV